MVFLELLDVDDDDFGLAFRIVDRLVVLDFLHQVLAALDGLYHEAASGEFVDGLLKKIEPVNDEKELCDSAALGIVVG